MSQGEVLKILEREKKWLTTREVAEQIGISTGNALRCLTVLFRFREIDRKTGKVSTFNVFLWRAK